MRDKLIELMSQHCPLEDCTRRAVMNCFECMTDHLIANGVTLQQWIPVSEPPEENVNVLVFGNGCRAISEIYSQDCDGEPMWQYTGIGCDPEYWMPLPSTEGLE